MNKFKELKKEISSDLNKIRGSFKKLDDNITKLDSLVKQECKNIQEDEVDNVLTNDKTNNYEYFTDLNKLENLEFFFQTAYDLDLLIMASNIIKKEGNETSNYYINEPTFTKKGKNISIRNNLDLDNTTFIQYHKRLRIYFNKSFKFKNETLRWFIGNIRYAQNDSNKLLYLVNKNIRNFRLKVFMETEKENVELAANKVR